MRKRRRSGIKLAIGAVCWTALACASAAAVVLLTSSSRPAPEFGVDIVRTPVPRDAHWQLQPITAPAAQLFFAGGKGPRADIEGEGAGDGEAKDQGPVELASLTQDTGLAGMNAKPGKIAALKSLADPAKRAAEKICLAEIVYYEGRGQPVEAQIAVGQTVVNRALSGAYPRTLCGVAHQHGARDGECQYSFACDGLSGIAKDRADWDLAQDLAERLLTGAVWLPEIGDATHSHPLAEHPAWAKYLQRVKRIGALVFYRGDFAGGAVGNPVATD